MNPSAFILKKEAFPPHQFDGGKPQFLIIFIFYFEKLGKRTGSSKNGVEFNFIIGKTNLCIVTGDKRILFAGIEKDKNGY